MCKLFLISSLFLFGNVFANNIAVIDKSILTNYKNQIYSEIKTSRCFSVRDQGSELRQPSDPFVDPNEYYFYKYVSFCPNKDYSDTSIGQRQIATHRNRSPRFTYYRHFLDDHMSDVIKVALRKTTAKVVPITTAYAESSTLDAFHESDKYSQGSLLQVVDSDLFRIKEALTWILGNHEIHDIRVVNISLAAVDDDGDERTFEMLPRYSSCDNQLPNSAYTFIKQKINLLKAEGVLTVSSAGGSSVYTNEFLSFPTCLSNVITVFGANYKPTRDRINGHFSIANKAHFVANYHQTGWEGNEVEGTSFSSAYVAGQLSELMKFNPATSSNQILIDATSTAYRRDFDFILPDGSREVITNLPIIDFSAARRRILSDATYGAYIDMIDSGSDSGKYGWNYGTRQHKNGVQVAVNTSSFSSVASASTVLNAPDQSISRTTSLDGSVAQATSTKTYYRFSLQGYDVDTASELKVYVNNRFYGYIVPTGNNTTGSRQYFYIEASHLNSTQTNFIKIVQSNSGETYGITNIQLARQSLSLITTSKTGSRITLSETENSTAYGYNGAGTYYSQLKSKFYYSGKAGLELSLRPMMSIKAMKLQFMLTINF